MHISGNKNMHPVELKKEHLHECRGASKPADPGPPTAHIKYAPKYRCDACDYECSRKFLWTQHCATQKHKRVTMVTSGSLTQPTGRSSKAKPYTCPVCKLSYVHRSGLSRHLKNTQCGYLLESGEGPIESGVPAPAVPPESSTERVLEKENGELRSMVKQLVAGLSQDAVAREEMVGQLKQQNEIIKEMIPRLGNNNNNRFNINVFLNERCRDAINMTEFIASLQVQLDDLRYTGTNGLVEGVSSVLVNGLRRLETCRRPIHCMDTQRDVLYIKDNDAWNRENGQGRLRSAIDDVANKQRKAISDWESHNPDWDKTEEGRAEYLHLVRSVMADISDNGGERKIIENIAKETVVSSTSLTAPTQIENSASGAS